MYCRRMHLLSFICRVQIFLLALYVLLQDKLDSLSPLVVRKLYPLLNYSTWMFGDFLINTLIMVIDFFLTIVDDYSRMTWIFLLIYKSEVAIFITAFLNLIRTPLLASVKIIRSDNGLEFVNNQCNNLLFSLGIIHQTTCVHTPQQNDISEQKHIHLLEIARALRFQADMSLKF